MQVLRALFAIALTTAPSVSCNHEYRRSYDPPNVSPTVPPNLNDCSFQYFSQQVDHFGNHNGTFPQKYNLVLDFFEPGGPIFFYQGEETTYLECVVSTPDPQHQPGIC
jgi:hypothetical protein